MNTYACISNVTAASSWRGLLIININNDKESIRECGCLFLHGPLVLIVAWAQNPATSAYMPVRCLAELGVSSQLNFQNAALDDRLQAAPKSKSSKKTEKRFLNLNDK